MMLMKKVWHWIKRKKWWIVGLLVVTAALAGYWYYQKQQKAVPPQTVNPEYRDITESLEVSGVVDALSKVSLGFPAAAKLTWVGVKEGDWVKKWQGVAKVDTATLEKQMLIDQNLHGKQFRSFEETVDDNDYYGGTPLTQTERRTVESAQLDLRNTALTAEIRDIAIKNAYLAAPIEGLVTRVDRPVANLYILPTDVFEIVDPRTMYFRIVVDEEDIQKIQVGQEVKVSLDAYPDEIYSGNVSRIAFAPAKTESGSLGYEVEINLTLDNSQGQYKLGMNGDGEVILAYKQSVLAVPVDSLISRDDKTYVEVWENGERKETEIQTGIESGDYAEVTSGLTGQEAVIVPESE